MRDGTTQPECCKNGLRETYIDDDFGRVYGWTYCACRAGLRHRYGLPELFLDWTTKTYPGPREALKSGAGWLDGPRDRWLILEGRFGAGKTGLAVCLYKTYIDRMIANIGEYGYIMASPRPALFWRVPDLIEAQKRTFGHEDMISPVDLAERAMLLVLDDIGAERYTEYNVDVIAQLIQRRYAARRRTVLTTNLTAAETRQAFGERIHDRLREVATVVSFGGKSLRNSGERVVV